MIGDITIPTPGIEFWVWISISIGFVWVIAFLRAMRHKEDPVIAAQSVLLLIAFWIFAQLTLLAIAFGAANGTT